MDDRLRRLALPLGLLAASLVTLAVAVWMFLEGPGAPAPSAVGGPFRLTAQDGRSVTDRDFRGAPFLVFFGFTNCPDVCPTAMHDVSEVFGKLGAEKKVAALFITVDPARDTPAALKDFLSSFDPRIVGLTGTPEEVAAALKAYRGYARKVPLKDGDYTMDHTAIVYLMDRQGRFVNAFNLSQAPDDAAKELARYL